METLNPSVVNRLSTGWKSGRTVANLQADTGLSRQSVLDGLVLAKIDPKDWRDRNRGLGKSLGPVSALKPKVQAICSAYKTGKSLEDLAEEIDTSRSSVRRALLQGGIELRPRGRPVKQAIEVAETAEA